MRILSKISIFFLVLTLLSTGLYVEPAHAGVSCGGKDHYHDRGYIKHDARYRYRKGGSVYKRWDIKKKMPSGFYRKFDRVNAYCWDVDIAKPLGTSNLLADPGLVLI